MIDIFGIIPNWSDRVKQNPSRTHEVEAQVSNEKRAPGCSFRMPVRARSGVPTYHRYLLFFFFFLIQGAFFWVGVGWGGDVNVPCTCTHT